MSAPDRRGCAICDTMPIADLTELDLFMGDASRWPPTIWGVFSVPKGSLNPRRQWFGGIKAGELWLREHGYAGQFSVEVLRKHYRYDVVVIAADVNDLINRGIIEAGDNRAAQPPETVDPLAFVRYFDRGIKLGNRSLELLAERLETMIQKKEDVPLALLLKLGDVGAKLATTQATLRARGMKVGDDDDSLEGFRAGSVPGGIPSPRLGHNRIRQIEGSDRPVADEGPADREHFSERSRQEGGEGLPH